MKRRWLALGMCAAGLVIAAAFALTGGGSDVRPTDAAPTQHDAASARTDSAFRRLLAAMSFKEAPRPASAPRSAAVPQYPAFIPADQLPWIARLRPDVRQFIEDRYPDPELRAGMLWVAAAQFQQITSGSQSGEAALAAEYDLWNAIYCVYALKGVVMGDRQRAERNGEIRLESNKEMKEIQALQLQSKEDFVLYSKHMANMAGKTLHAPKGTACAR